MRASRYFSPEGKVHKAKVSDRWCQGDYIAICGNRAEYVAHETEGITCKHCLRILAGTDEVRDERQALY